MKNARLYKRPHAQLICEDTPEGVIEVFNEIDPLEREQYFMMVDNRIFHADEIEKLQSE